MPPKKDQLRQQLKETAEKGLGPKAARMALQFAGGMIPIKQRHHRKAMC